MSLSSTIGESKGGARDAQSWTSKFFQFHAVFGKIWQNCVLAPPVELAPQSLWNPSSITEDNDFYLSTKLILPFTFVLCQNS